MASLDLFSQQPQKQAVQSRGARIEFNKVIGQEKIKSQLKRALLNKRVNKAYLFYGPEGCGKDAMAVEFGKALNCSSTEEIPCQTCSQCRLIGQLTHPDLKFVFAAPQKIKEEDVIAHIRKKAEDLYYRSAYTETAGILIEKIRDLKKAATMKLYKGKSRIFIISEADRMTLEASNSLLKLLEEPPEHLILILTTSRIDKLLPTIISRCQVVKFSPLDEDSIKRSLIEKKVEENQANVVARLSMGSIRKAVQLLEEDHQTIREQAWKLLMVAHRHDELEKLSTIETIVTGKDRGQIKEVLLSALQWLRDAQILRFLENDKPVNQNLFNDDQREKLIRLGEAYKLINLEKTITETENCIDLVDKNVYINLILINYINSIYDNKL